MKDLILLIENQLLKNVIIKSIHPKDPVVTKNIPKDWYLIGSGNYAAVFYHKDFSHVVIKVYAEGKEGIKSEIDVYKLIGNHPSYSECYHFGANYLILKRLKGTTLYDCFRKGIYIPKSIIEDIDNALEYAKTKNLNPHDVHFKNVGMGNGKGYVIDISDFLKNGFV